MSNKKKMFKFYELGISAKDTAILLWIASKYGKEATDLLTDQELDMLYEDIQTQLEKTDNIEFNKHGRILANPQPITEG